MSAGGIGNDKSADLKRNESEDPIYDENLSEVEGSMTTQKANGLTMRNVNK